MEIIVYNRAILLFTTESDAVRRHYLPYAVQNPRFDPSNARAVGLAPPAFAAYFPRLLAYAQELARERLAGRLRGRLLVRRHLVFPA